MTLTLQFDTPPSANNFYYNMPGRGRAVSTEGRAWRETAGKQIMVQRPKHIAGPVNLGISIEDVGRADLDGKAKPIIDLLVGHGVIEDDNRRIVRAITMRWQPDIKGVVVTVEGCNAMD